MLRQTRESKKATRHNLIFWHCLALFCFISVSAQTETDRQNDELKGAVRSVKIYDIFYFDKGKSRSEKRLAAIAKYDLAGHLIELFYVLYDGVGFSYQKYKYKFDAQGRRAVSWDYTSARINLEQIKTFENLVANNRPLTGKLAENLKTKTVRKFLKNGKESEETSVDASGKVVDRQFYTYNRKGKEIRFIAFQEDGKPRLEYRRVYKNKGRQVEVTRLENSKPNFKIIYFYDRKGRYRGEKQFDLTRATDGINLVATPNNTYKEIVSGKITEDISINFDKNGLPAYKYWRRYRDDLELSEIEYKNHPSPAEKTGAVQKTHWVLNSQTKRRYQFDKNGSWTKVIFLRQEAPDNSFFISDSEERVIQYYGRNRLHKGHLHK